MINPASKAKQEELDAKLKARAEAIANMDNIIIATRPSYKKLLEKRKRKRHGSKITTYL